MHQKPLFGRITAMEQQNGQKLNKKQSDDLFNRIMLEMRREQKKADQIRAAFFSFTFIASLLAFVPALNLLRANLTASGFMDYFSLLFSDWGVIAEYWQSFVLSLLEVLPVMSLAVFLAVIFVFLESLKHLATEIPPWRIRFKLN